MKLDARELAAFYDSALGEMARRIILHRLRQFWPQVGNQRLLGYGFATPYLKIFSHQAERVIAALPADMGVIGWPPEKSLATLAEEDALPFPDAFFDRILVVHGLEGAQALRPLLRQLWRVLAPEGRLLIVAPNRASLWAQVERSPFGYGRPFSRAELDAILCDALFVPEKWQRALYAPPSTAACWSAAAQAGNGSARAFCRRWAGCISPKRENRCMPLPPQPPRRRRNGPRV